MTFKELINNSVESQITATETELPPAPVLNQVEVSNLSCLALEMFSSNSDRFFFFLKSHTLKQYEGSKSLLELKID